MFFLPISGRSRINLDVILYINTSPKPKFYCLTSRPTSDFLFFVLLFEFLFYFSKTKIKNEDSWVLDSSDDEVILFVE